MSQHDMMTLETRHNPASLAELNMLNTRFWSEQGKSMCRRLKNPALCLIAMNDLSTQQKSKVPFGMWKTFEQALAQAEEANSISLRGFASKGGRALKTDALQHVIIKIVRGDPNITRSHLLRSLGEMAKSDHPVIHAVDQKGDLLKGDVEQIHFWDRGKEQTAAISGLKDRLCRAKKIVSR